MQGTSVQNSKHLLCRPGKPSCCPALPPILQLASGKMRPNLRLKSRRSPHRSGERCRSADYLRQYDCFPKIARPDRRIGNGTSWFFRGRNEKVLRRTLYDSGRHPFLPYRRSTGLGLSCLDLVPITLLGMISVVIVELAVGAGVSAAIGHGVLLGSAPQIGYAFGLLARHGMVIMRSPRRASVARLYKQRRIYQTFDPRKGR